ncbi:MAG: alpha/beta hydrolase [Gemmatimonadales bacterium]
MGQRPGRTTAYLCFALSSLLLFTAIWIVVPPPSYPLLILAVGAPEAGVWLAVGAALITMIVYRDAATSRVARVTLCFSVATIVLAILPLLRFPSTVRRFDAAMRAGLGENYLCAVPDPTLRTMRPAPLNPVELFTGLRPGAARVERGVRFAVNDGVPLSMDVYHPGQRGSYPAVVQIYGGAWQRGEPGDNAAFATYLASHGYVVFAIDYRHAPRWQWPAQLADLRAALAWIVEHGQEYDADSGRLALIGRSSGAQLALVGAYAPGGPRVGAVVSYYGPVDLAEGYRHPPRPDPLRVRGIEEAFLGGTPANAAARYRDASPIAYTLRPLPPTLLVYAAHDHVVEARFGTLLHERLRATGTTSVLLEIPWSEHGFDAMTGGPGAQLALFNTERFLAWALRSSEPARCTISPGEGPMGGPAPATAPGPRVSPPRMPARSPRGTLRSVPTPHNAAGRPWPVERRVPPRRLPPR